MFKHKSIIASLLIILILALAVVCQAGGPPTPKGIYKGEVIEIYDGDTPRVIIESPLGDAVRRLRLGGGVDCPEKNQPWGDVALARTRELIEGQPLIIELTGAVTFQRPVALIWLPDGRELGKVLVTEGLAWVDPRYAKGARGRELKALMAQAKAAKRGLWADKNPIEPWRWRKGARGK